MTAVGNEAYSLVAELLLTHRGAGSRYLLRVTDQSMTAGPVEPARRGDLRGDGCAVEDLARL